jgi:hypothetical protein
MPDPCAAFLRVPVGRKQVDHDWNMKRYAACFIKNEIYAAAYTTEKK